MGIRESRRDGEREGPELDAQAELELHREELASQNEELRRANAELVRRRERQTQLYELAPIGYVTVDLEGVVLQANATAVAMLQRGAPPLVGSPLIHVVAASERGRFRTFLENLVAGTGRSVLETVLDGAVDAIPAVIHGARLGGAETTECLLAVVDDRVRRDAAKLRQDHEAAVAEALRLDCLRLLAGGVAHDFNNLLAVILGMTELAIHAPPQAAHEALESAREAAKRAAALSKQILAYTGQGRIEPRPLDLRRSLEDLKPVLRGLVTADVRLVFEIADEPLLVNGDVSQIDQIVLNLVLNAAQALPDQRGTITIGLRAGLGVVELIVADDGVGMAEVVRARVFDPFFTTKPSGRGLGLAVVHGNVKSHGGSVICESAEGAGTRFRVVLPAYSTHAAGAAIAPARGGVASGTRVLVVDDEPLLLRSCTKLLERLGYAVATASGGAEALDAVARAPYSYSLAIVDLTMPDMSGRETTEKIRRLRPNLPIVLMSGYSADASLARITPWFLAKPFTLDELDAVVSRALAITDGATATA